MSTARPLVALGAATLMLGLTACKPKQPVQPTPPATAAEPVEPVAQDEPAAEPEADVEKVEVRATLENPEDLINALTDLQKRIDPSNAQDPLVMLRGSLLAQGFAPAFLDNIRLDGLHTAWFAFPAEQGAGPDAIDLAASVDVKNAGKVINATPSNFKAQPLGDGVFEIRLDNSQVLLQDAGKELLIGLSQEDLKKAPGLRADAGKGRRLRARAWNLPMDDLDPLEVLGIPRDVPFVAQLAAIAKEMDAVELEVDFGTKKQLEVVTKVEAPWEKLGLSPIGKARKKATALEKVLPANAFFVTTLSWGNPKVLHKTIDQNIRVGQIPPPFSDIAAKALKGAKTLLNQVSNDVVLAFYVDAKGQAAVVLAADVKNDDKTRNGMRKIDEAIAEALQAHATLQGKNNNAKFKVDVKKEGLRMAGVKADRVTIRIPKDFQDDFDNFGPFLKKNAVESVSFVKNGVAVLAIGAGARGVATAAAKGVAKAPASSLANDAGLRALRAGMGGCQVCATVDFTKYLQFRLLLLEKSGDKGVAKEAKTHRTKVAKLDGVDAGAGLRFKKSKGVAGLVVPKKTIQLSADRVKELMTINEFIESGGASTSAAPR